LRPKTSVVKDLVESAIASAAGLTIAGYDPSSGAGVTADLQVFAEHSVFGVSAITALTVQSTRGVRRVEPVSEAVLRETLDCLGGDRPIGGVKIGMLATAELVGVVAEWLQAAQIGRERVVLDPVIRASSGAELLEPAGVRRMVAELLPLVGWVTPNLGEAGALLGEGAPDREAVPEAAARIAGLGGARGGGRTLSPFPNQNQARPGQGSQEKSGLNVVVTGGHLEPPDDFLRTASGEERWIRGTRVEARSRHGTHGTGCVFSSALLCRLMLGGGAVEAVEGAKAWVVQRLEGRASRPR
jgi:hydroxymethylpyrimidine/phosphomethylpyrimidine kinase